MGNCTRLIALVSCLKIRLGDILKKLWRRKKLLIIHGSDRSSFVRCEGQTVLGWEWDLCSLVCLIATRLTAMACLWDCDGGSTDVLRYRYCPVSRCAATGPLYR